VDVNVNTYDGKDTFTFDVTTLSNKVEVPLLSINTEKNLVLYKQEFRLNTIGTVYKQNVAITPAVIETINTNVANNNKNIDGINDDL